MQKPFVLWLLETLGFFFVGNQRTDKDKTESLFFQADTLKVMFYNFLLRADQ